MHRGAGKVRLHTGVQVEPGCVQGCRWSEVVCKGAGRVRLHMDAGGVRLCTGVQVE